MAGSNTGSPKRPPPKAKSEKTGASPRKNTLDKLGQPWKAKAMLVTAAPIVTVVRLSQSRNAPFGHPTGCGDPILVTLSGIVTSVSLVASANAPSPMTTTLLGIV